MTVTEPDTWTWPDAYGSQKPPLAGWMRGLTMERNAAEVDRNRLWMAFVQNIAIAGQNWSVATDGKAMLAIMDTGDENWHNGHLDSQVFAQVGGQMEKTIRDLIVCDTIQEFECDLNDLLQFFGPYQLEKCSDCNGEGCEDCTNGETWPDPLDGLRIMYKDRWFDKTMLAKYLTPFRWYCNRVRIGFQKTFTLQPDQQAMIVEAVGFNSEKLRAVIMGMTRQRFMGGNQFHYRTHANSPRYIPGIGALWHLYKTSFDAPLRDWIQERDEDPDEVLGVPF